MNIKRLSACAAALVLSLSMSVPAFAFVDETAVEETTPAEPETVVETVEETTEPAVEEPEAMDPLTPDGNLTLVDDCGKSTGVGKQFVTMVTKNGNYFYLVIDRDDKGEENVHFLNQVDEADLLSLMDDEEAQKYQPIVEETKPEESEPEPVTEPEQPQPETKKPNLIPALLGLLVLIGGGGYFGFKKLSEKKKAEEEKPDQDADYEEEAYDYPDEEELDIPEDDADEEYKEDSEDEDE